VNSSPRSATRVRDLILKVAFTDPERQHELLRSLIEREELEGPALLAARRLLETDTVLHAPRGVTYSTTEPIEIQQ
jgi:hypothetical protein